MYMKVGSPEWNRLLKQLYNNDVSLTWLDLTLNDIGNDGAKALAQALKGNHTLIDLNLWKCKIGNDGAKALSQALKDNKTLRVLNLDHNKIGNDGAKALGQVLKDNKTLKYLNLNCNQFGDGGAKALSQGLQDNRTLLGLKLIEGSKDIAWDIYQEIEGYLKRNEQLYQQLYQAIQKNDLFQVQTILQQGIGLLSTNEEGQTPLHWAVLADSESITRYLISLMHQQGLLLIKRDKEGKTAYDLAEKKPALRQLFVETPTAKLEPNNLSNKREIVQQITEINSLDDSQNLKQVFQTALDEHLAQHHLTFERLTQVKAEEIAQSMRAQWGQEQQAQFSQLLQSEDYFKQEQTWEKTLLAELQTRQGKIDRELSEIQQVQATIKDPLNTLYQQYQTKKQKLLEQQALQEPKSVYIFYQTIEKVLGAKLVAAMSLASGMIQRSTTKMDQAGKITGNILGSLAQGIPVVGGIIGGIMGLAIEEGVSTVKDQQQEMKYQTVSDSIIRFEDALILAELVARRLAQSYRGYIESQALNLEDIQTAGEQAAETVYNFIKIGKLEALGPLSLEEKVTALLAEVHYTAQNESRLFKKTGGIFKAILKAQDIQLSPADRKHIANVTSHTEKLASQVEFTQQFAQIKIEHVQKENTELKVEITEMKKELETLKQQRPLSPPPSLYFKPQQSAFASKETFQAAIQAFQDRTSNLLTYKYTLEINRQGKEVYVVCKETEYATLLMSLAEHLQVVLTEAVLKKIDATDNTLTLKTHNPLQAERLETFLREIGFMPAVAFPSTNELRK